MPLPHETLDLQWLDRLVPQEARVHLHEQIRSCPCSQLLIIITKPEEALRLINGRHRQIIGNEMSGQPLTMDQLTSVRDRCLQ